MFLVCLGVGDDDLQGVYFGWGGDAQVVAEVSDFLFVTIFKNLYFVGLKVRDDFPMVVRHDGIYLHQIRRDPDNVYLI